MEYSNAVVETFFACTGPGAMGVVDDGGPSSGSTSGRASSSSKQLTPSSVAPSGGTNNLASLGAAEAVAYVAAGGILSPGDVPGGRGGGRRPPSEGSGGRVLAPCPALPPGRLLAPGGWNPLGSLARSMVYCAAGSCETAYLREGGPFERLPAGAGEGGAPHAPEDCVAMIEGIAGRAAPPALSSAEGGAVAAPIVKAEEVFQAHLLQLLGVAIAPAMGRVERGQKLNEMLMDVVINVVRFPSCSHLYLLMCSCLVHILHL